LNFYARLAAEREAYLRPRERLAERVFSRWQRLRAEKRYQESDRLLRRARAAGIHFEFISWSGPEWQFAPRMFFRFGRRFESTAAG